MSEEIILDTQAFETLLDIMVQKNETQNELIEYFYEKINKIQELAIEFTESEEESYVLIGELNKLLYMGDKP